MNERHHLREVRFEGVDAVVRARPVPRAWLAPATGPFSRTGAEEPVTSLLTTILARAGLDPKAYRRSSLERRLSACVRRLRATDADHASELLARDEAGALTEPLLDTLLIGVTEFFRDPAVFTALEREVLPELLFHKAGLRVCSLGSSAGQELYSVAMLLTEAGALARSELTGIERREAATAKAAIGWYDDVRGVSTVRRSAFFTDDRGGWRVRSALRHRAVWRTQDLFTYALEEPQDIILFRNVAIYLDEERTAAVWSRIAGDLVPGGFLVTGKAERPPAGLPFERAGACLFRRA